MILEYNLQFFADGPGGEKTEEPTSKKLSDARKEGQVAKSKEVASSVMLFLAFVFIKIFAGSIGNQLKDLFAYFYNMIPQYSKLPGGHIESRDYYLMISNVLLRILILISPFLIMGVVVAFVCDLLQVKWAPTSKPLQPKFNKLNPVSGLKKIFSVQSLIELLKSLLKIAVMVIIIYNEIKKNATLIFFVYEMPLMQAVSMACDFLVSVGLKISAVFLVIAAADFIYQKWKFRKDMKMTKQEVKEEYKSTEGDPQIKGKIRQKMQEASRRRMMQNVPKADVVITNPTHYAVAIVYDKEYGEAPVVLAKGTDFMAQKIKEIARENNVAIRENKPLARSLYANVEIGEQVPPELYIAVAEVLAAVYKAEGRV